MEPPAEGLREGLPWERGRGRLRVLLLQVVPGDARELLPAPAWAAHSGLEVLGHSRLGCISSLLPDE